MRSRLTCSKPGLAGPADDGRAPGAGRGCGRGWRARASTADCMPKRDPGEAGLAQRGQVPGGDAVGVGLGGDLGAGRQPELARRSRRSTAARSPAAEQRSACRRRRRPSRPAGRGRRARAAASRTSAIAASAYVAREAPGWSPELVGGVGVEVAVAAPHRAERHVHVEAERAGAELGEGRRRQRPVGGRGSPGGSEDGIRPSNRRRPGVPSAVIRSRRRR